MTGLKNGLQTYGPLFEMYGAMFKELAFCSMVHNHAKGFNWKELKKRRVTALIHYVPVFQFAIVFHSL